MVWLIWRPWAPRDEFIFSPSGEKMPPFVGPGVRRGRRAAVPVGHLATPSLRERLREREGGRCLHPIVPVGSLVGFFHRLLGSCLARDGLGEHVDQHVVGHGGGR